MLKPTACLLAVLLQWAAWSQIGLEGSTDSGVARVLAPESVELAKTAKKASESHALKFEQGQKAPHTADFSDFCRQLKEWPLPGCSIS